MISKVTAVAPANIAFVKYWGALDIERALPRNVTISMTLDRCVSRTTAAFEEGARDADDIAVVDDAGVSRAPSASFRDRAQRHIDRLRHRARRQGRFRIVTRNSFPMGAGIASSASGFAALTLAAWRAMGADAGTSELSILARESGSGSAARSVIGGYVEWPSDPLDPESPASEIAPASHWKLCDVVTVVDAGEKDVASVDGHRRAATSPHYETRLRLLEGRLAAVRGAILARDLGALGPALEEEAIELHLVAMSSRPPVFYWKPGTLCVLEEIRGLRRNGVPAWFTMDAGANVHVICEPRSEREVVERISALPEVRSVISDGVGEGPRFEAEHLF